MSTLNRWGSFAVVALLSSSPALAKTTTWDSDVTFDNQGVYIKYDNVQHVTAPGGGNGHNQLQLADKLNGGFPFLWVANYIDDTVTKIDTVTGRESARYDSLLMTNWDGTVPNIPAVRTSINWPSRTALDSTGDAYVSNRAFGGYPSVTKYVGLNTLQCQPHHGDKVHTSRDVNGDGHINVDCNANGVWDTLADVVNNPNPNLNHCTNGLEQEFYGQDDDCISWTKNTAGFNDYGRSLAVDPDHNVWALGYVSSKMYHLDGTTGQLLEVIDPNREACIAAYSYAECDPDPNNGSSKFREGYPGYYWGRVYGIAIDGGAVDPNDPNNILYNVYTSDIDYRVHRKLAPKSTIQLKDGQGNLVFDNMGKPVYKHIVSAYQGKVPTYGLAVDGDGVLWLGNWSGWYGGGVERIDFSNTDIADAPMKAPASDNVFAGNQAGCSSYTRGVAVDDNGDVFFSCFYATQLLKVDSAGNFKQSWGVGAYPIGVGVEPYHKVWTVNQSGRTVSRVDTINNVVNTFPTVGDTYTYSDLNGFQYKNFTNAGGTWTVIWDSGVINNHVVTADWNLNIPLNDPTYYPPGSNVKVTVAASDDLNALKTNTVKPVPVVKGQQYAIDPNSPWSNGRYVMIVVQLQRAKSTPTNRFPPSPIVKNVVLTTFTTPKAICDNQTTCADPKSCLQAQTLALGSASYDPSNPNNPNAVTRTTSPAQPFAYGTNTYQLTVKDVNGYTDTCNGTVIVKNCTPPVVQCPTFKSQYECSFFGGTSFQPGDPTALSYCGTTINYWDIQPDGNFFPLGSDVITYTAIDSDGNKGSCTGNVKVVDTTPPTLTCPPQQVVECTGATSATVTPADANAADLCTNVTVVPPPSGSYPLGTTPTSYSAYDSFGNTSTCSSSIVVADTQPPTVTAVDTAAKAPSGGFITINVLTDCQVTANDTCYGTVTPTTANTRINCVQSNETDPGSIVFVDATHVSLRATNLGANDTRVYRLSFSVKDPSGNGGTAVCRVPINGNGSWADNGGQGDKLCQ